MAYIENSDVFLRKLHAWQISSNEIAKECEHDEDGGEK